MMDERFSGLENSSVPARKKRKIIHEEEEPKFYYVFINSLSALLKSQTAKSDKKKEISDRCLYSFTTKYH